MAVTIEKVAADYERAAAISEIRKMAAKIPYYLSNFRMNEMVKMFAKDCSIAMPWGCYDGERAAERFCLEDYGDRNDPEKQEALKGCMFIYDWNSEMLCVAEDMQTARGFWMSEGAETYGDHIHQYEHGLNSYWHFMKYGIDFIKEDGVWKFWHIQAFPLYRIPYNETWCSSIPYHGFLLRETHVNRLPLATPFVWTLDSILPSDQPYFPMPYKTFADVEPGYGYKLIPGYGGMIQKYSYGVIPTRKYGNGKDDTNG